MRKRTSIPALIAATLFIAGCAQSGATNSTATPTPTAAAPTASASAGQTLIVLADYPQSSPDTTPIVLHLVRTDGTEANRLTLKPKAMTTMARGSRIFVMEAGALKALHRDGTVEDLNTLNSSALNGSLIASPDGNTWLWADYATNGQGTVYIASKGTPPQIVEQSRENARGVRPFAWTQRGPVIEHGAVGIGGYILYYTASGPVDLVDPISGQFRPLTVPSNCSFSDLAMDGTVACFPANGTGHSLSLIASNGKVTSVTLPADRFAREGAAYFRPGDGEVTAGGAIGAGPGQEKFASDLVKTSDGSIKALSLDDVRPANGASAWLPDGSLVVYRPQFAAAGPGVWLVRADGSTTKIASGGEPIGYLTE